MYRQKISKTIPVCFKTSGVYCISIKEHFYIGSSKNIQQRIAQHRKKLRGCKHQSKFQIYYGLYGETEMYISILEMCDPDVLKSREKYWIEALNPDINFDRINTTNPQKILYNGVGSKKVYQYDLEGNYIAEFPSVQEAGRYLNIYPRTIGLCAIKKYAQYKSANGYQWSYDKLDKMPKYINNSDKAVNKPLIVFDVITGIEKQFKSVADAVRLYNTNVENFNSDCASLGGCANRGGFYLSRYIAKRKENDAYILPKRNSDILDIDTNTTYKDAKEASKCSGISVFKIKKLCKKESNRWLYLTYCARVKLSESGKLFI